MPIRHFYLLSHYICYRRKFFFSVCWLRKEWMQQSLERDGEEDRKVPACSEEFFHGIRLLKFRKQVIFGYRSLKVPSRFLNRLYMSIIMFTNHETFFQLLNYTNPKVFTHLNKTHPTHTSSPV